MPQLQIQSQVGRNQNFHRKKLQWNKIWGKSWWRSLFFTDRCPRQQTARGKVLCWWPILGKADKTVNLMLNESRLEIHPNPTVPWDVACQRLPLDEAVMQWLTAKSEPPQWWSSRTHIVLLDAMRGPHQKNQNLTYIYFSCRCNTIMSLKSPLCTLWTSTLYVLTAS